MRSLRRRHHRTLAQTTTEYMLVISVICVAVYFTVTNAMYPVLEDGSAKFKQNQMKTSKDGFVGQGYKGGERR